MSSKNFQCPRCFKRCGNAGALKTHMKSHKSEPKSGSLLKWIVKRKPAKIEKKQRPKEPIELQPILKTRQLKLRNPPVRESAVVANPVRPRPPRKPRKSKQAPIDTSPFVAPSHLTASDLDRRSPQFRIAHVQHFRALKDDFPILDKKMYHQVNKSSLGVSLRWFQTWFNQYEEESEYEEVVIPKKQQSAKRKREVSNAADSKRAKPNRKPRISIPKKSAPRANNQVPKKRPRASMDVPGPPTGPPPKRLKPNQFKPSSIPSRR